MKLKFLSCLIIFLVFSSCSTTYYLCETGQETPIYYKKSNKSKKIVIIPQGKEVVSKGRSKYRKIKYNETIGWVYMPTFKSEKKYNYNGEFKVIRKKRTPSYFNNSGGTINVKGYYRKDGTYVRPHTRRKS